MREIKIVVAACVVLLFASFAAAQVPTSGNVFFGYSYYNADLSTLGRSNLSGWTGSLEGRVFPHVGMVADFSQTFGSESVTILCPGPPCPSQSISAHEYNMLFGPRVSFSVGKLRPFAEALFGLGTSARMTQGRTRPSPPGWAVASITASSAHRLRFEGDYLQTRFNSTTQNNLRLSTGIVFRF